MTTNMLKHVFTCSPAAEYLALRTKSVNTTPWRDAYVLFMETRGEQGIKLVTSCNGALAWLKEGGK
jgi:hypothetical protein